MKKTTPMKPLLLLFLTLLHLSLYAQTPQDIENCPRYKKFMDKGNALYDNDKSSALNEYLSAQIAARECNIPTNEAKAAINHIYNAIKQDRDKLDKSLKIADAAKENEKNQRRIAVKSEKDAKTALAQTKKVLGAFYFFEDKYALAYGSTSKFNNKFYFIDREGNQKDSLGNWDRAEQFDDFGVSKVRNNDEEYVLTTNGDTCLLSTAYITKGATKGKALPHYLAYNWQNRDLTTIPTLLLLKPDVKFVFASQNRIDSIANLQNSTGLIYLDLSNNKIRNWLDNLGKNVNLEYLDVSGNRELNKNTKTLGSIKSLAKLKVLKASRLDHIAFLPDGIGALDSLVILQMNADSLTSLPAEIGKLKDLRRLDVSNNHLTILPQAIGGLSKLTYLNLASNALTTLPPEIGKLEKLRQLYVNSDSLKELAKDIKKLKRLELLDLSSNSLSSLPGEIGSLDTLTILLLGSNQLSKLPSEIAQVRFLTDLDLSRNLFDKFPSGLTRLPKLLKLNLSDNKLTSLPASIKNLSSLQYLNLEGNPLKSLPKEIAGLQNLTNLVLTNDTLLTKLPLESLKQLKNLKFLHLENTPKLIIKDRQKLRDAFPGCTLYFDEE